MAAGPRPLRWLALALLLGVHHAVPQQALPPLERVEDEMREMDIVLEGDNKIWMRLPRPFFMPGDARPHPPNFNFSDGGVRNASSILVFIASLRETKIGSTLLTLFQHAVLPSRVFVGVVQQNERNDPDALEELCRRMGTPLQLRQAFRGRRNLHVRQEDEDAWGQTRYTAESLAACEPALRVRMHRMDAAEAKGPAYARSHQLRLLRQGKSMEDFCLQIDAHTVFVRGWDTHLADEWALTENEYAVLTTYPMNAIGSQAGNEPINDQGRWAMPHLCKATFERPGIVRNSRAGAVANLQSPALTKFWAAGLSFSRCHAERDVPNDPGLTHIFSGEEFSRGARLWTNGYDMYSMMRPYVVTYYGDDKGGKGHWRINDTEMHQAWGRLETLLRHHEAPRSEQAVAALRGYDLGTRRRYDDYIKLTGMDTVNQTVTDTPCAVTKWTPWLPDSQPPYEVLLGSPGRLGAGAAAREEPREAVHIEMAETDARLNESRPHPKARSHDDPRAQSHADREERGDAHLKDTDDRKAAGDPKLGGAHSDGELEGHAHQGVGEDARSHDNLGAESHADQEDGGDAHPKDGGTDDRKAGEEEGGDAHPKDGGTDDRKAAGDPELSEAAGDPKPSEVHSDREQEGHAHQGVGEDARHGGHRIDPNADSHDQNADKDGEDDQGEETHAVQKTGQDAQSEQGLGGQPGQDAQSEQGLGGQPSHEVEEVEAQPLSDAHTEEVVDGDIKGDTEALEEDGLEAVEGRRRTEEDDPDVLEGEPLDGDGGGHVPEDRYELPGSVWDAEQQHAQHGHEPEQQQQQKQQRHGAEPHNSGDGHGSGHHVQSPHASKHHLSGSSPGRTSRFLQAPAFAADHANGLQLAMLASFSLAAVGTLATRKYWMRHRTGKST